MAAPTGKFVHLDSATLTTMQTNLSAAYTRALEAQSYSTAGGGRSRSKQSAELTAISDDLAEVGYALSVKSGSGGIKMTYANISSITG